MQIIREKQKESLLLRLIGRLDTSTAPELQKVINGELDNVTELRIDMQGMEYVSSAGLRELLAASKKMKEKNGDMSVYHVNREVMEVFEITGFKRILNVQ